MIVKASFDDGTRQDFRIAELMSKYEIPTIFYWPAHLEMANKPKHRKSLTASQQDQIAEYFEIGSHTMSHPLLTRIPIETAEVEISHSRTLLQDRFNQEINSFCYPRGYSNPDIQNLVQDAGYTNARSTLVGYVHESENKFFEQTAVHVGCDRKEYAGLNWFDYGMKLLEVARKVPDSVFHIWGHSYEIDQAKQWEQLEIFLKEVML